MRCIEKLRLPDGSVYPELKPGETQNLVCSNVSIKTNHLFKKFLCDRLAITNLRILMILANRNVAVIPLKNVLTVRRKLSLISLAKRCFTIDYSMIEVILDDYSAVYFSFNEKCYNEALSYLNLALCRKDWTLNNEKISKSVHKVSFNLPLPSDKSVLREEIKKMQELVDVAHDKMLALLDNDEENEVNMSEEEREQCFDLKLEAVRLRQKLGAQLTSLEYELSGM